MGRFRWRKALKVIAIIGLVYITLSRLLIGQKEDGLCVVILSSPTNREARDVLRESWLTLEESVAHYFFIGEMSLESTLSEEIYHEKYEHGDVVLLPMKDSYDKLSEKLIKSIDWIVNNVKCRYILKADDDTFARIDLLISELDRVEVEDQLYWGYFTGRAPVFKSGKWAEPDWFLSDRYLPYARGGGYIFSAKIAKFISSNKDMLKRYKSEDVSFGVWTSALMLNRVHDVRFDTEYKSRGCVNSMLVTHKQSPQEMLKKMASLRSSGRLCSEENVIKKPYQYNWTLPASRCCDVLV